MLTPEDLMCRVQEHTALDQCPLNSTCPKDLAEFARPRGLYRGRIWGYILGLYGDNGKENGDYYSKMIPEVAQSPFYVGIAAVLWLEDISSMAHQEPSQNLENAEPFPSLKPPGTTTRGLGHRIRSHFPNLKHEPGLK